MDPRPLWIAIRFLSRLPCPDPGVLAPDEAGRAVPWYPLVGLLIGGLLALAAPPLAGAPSGVAAALLLILWVGATGALHLDGLADTADAWVGGLGSRERTLEIMRDPHSGPMGVAALIVVLLAKWAALDALLAATAADPAPLIWLLLAVPLLARAQLPLLLLTTPYARARGMATAAVAGLPRRAAAGAVLLAGAGVVLGAVLIDRAGSGLLALLLALLLFAGARQALLARLGGFTGDTAGALVELTETALLLALALALSPSLPA